MEKHNTMTIGFAVTGSTNDRTSSGTKRKLGEERRRRRKTTYEMREQKRRGKRFLKIKWRTFLSLHIFCWCMSGAQSKTRGWDVQGSRIRWESPFYISFTIGTPHFITCTSSSPIYTKQYDFFAFLTFHLYQTQH